MRRAVARLRAQNFAALSEWRLAKWSAGEWKLEQHLRFDEKAMMAFSSVSPERERRVGRMDARDHPAAA